MKPHFIPLFFALSVTLSATAATPCAENTVCAQTNTIEGHGFGNSAPTFEVPSDDDHTIGRNGIKVDQLSTEDEDGDSVDISSVKYHWCVDAENYCFQQNSRELVLAPNQIDKVFTKGTGFKKLTVAYSGEMQKGYPEETRKFTSEATEVDLEYPADFTDGICYEIPGNVVGSMDLNTDSPLGVEVTHHLEFPQMALDTLPGKLSTKTSDPAVNFKPEISGLKLKFQQKALPDVLEIWYSNSNGAATPKKLTVNKVTPGGNGAPIIYSFLGAVIVNGITVTNFSFVLNTQDIDYRKYMAECNDFNTP
ncbi:hypothetical protein BS333_08690 [Vibrio azureus]|uniref:Uncharacterized protein n=1 Tax=Vibrio azureus NBRC 104587 TaxID=1219077 RepID=U3A237_9VIBR|nr:hypothetical protein [Vibrio azureus]AUI86457.1 hypothetical protein BS333_08690 [Vibrio azureus]GAD74066.1 hypothetical protein VAZ01S_001_00040 [Vibrio azureus NBRC 104587]